MPQASAEIIARIDGASRGNPGPAAYAVIIESAEGEVLDSLSRQLGTATNNFAEYHGLLAALEYALENRHPHLRVLSDSELLVRQIEGRYKVKSPGLVPLHERATHMIAGLESFRIQYVPREQNREADRLANRTLDGTEKSPSRPARDARAPSKPAATGPLRTSAVYRGGVLELQEELPLEEGEEVQIEVRRRNPRAG